MAKILSPQDIPAALAKGYSAALSTKETGEDILHIRRRPPFRIGTLQGCREIRPPIPRGEKVSDAMAAQRHVFCDCVKCFQKQPLTGGAVPPAIGPRNRSWWYDDAAESGWWYFCWFMKATLDKWLSGFVPNWCKKMGIGDTFTSMALPNQNYGGWLSVNVGNLGEYGGSYGWIKKPAGDLKTLNLWNWDCHYQPFPPPPPEEPVPLLIKVYAPSGDWNENTITWNNQPALNNFLGYLTIPTDFPQWVQFYVGDHDRIALQMITVYGTASFASMQWTGDAEYKPCWTA